MSKDNSPVSASMQPGTHLSVDSRPGTVETPFKGKNLHAEYILSAFHNFHFIS